MGNRQGKDSSEKGRDQKNVVSKSRPVIPPPPALTSKSSSQSIESPSRSSSGSGSSNLVADPPNQPMISVNPSPIAQKTSEPTPTISCPVCQSSLDGMNEFQINNHVESCLGNSEPNTGFVDDSFSVRCPYINCGSQFEVCDFPRHVQASHSNEAQNYGCPICGLLGGAPFVPNTTTNLLQHIQRTHAEFLNAKPSPPAPTPTRTTVSKPQPKATPQVLSSEYIVSPYTGTNEPECGICYEEITKGAVAARLSCFCLFHNHCVQAWFQKKGSNECPFHMKREEHS